MKPFDYARATTIAETIALLDGEHGIDGDHARILAGGTDLITLMKAEIVAPTRLIDIKRIAELEDTIELTAQGLRIGALTPLSEVQDSRPVQDAYPALAEAVAVAASPQLRNMATIGGNILQRPRCWYFRDDQVHCWLKGGDECQAVDGENQQHAIFGGSPCHATHASDLATALLALGASVILHGPSGERTVALDAFFALPTDDRRTENTLASDELIVAIEIPKRSATTRSAYLKAMDRKVWAFALIGVGALLDIEDGRITDARLALGGVEPIPRRALDAESLLVGSEPGTELFDRVADLALAGAAPLSHNGYKVPLAKTLIRRTLETASQPRTMNA